ncbi:hypothetical protein TWF694_008012 [Orbilia ellipsospora]|uniref:Uncharacterized protein n=1 Tax=Orbilia ellipsospora TaxID=2528407 RepID=A0AAV9XEV2_9PEZI
MPAQTPITLPRVCLRRNPDLAIRCHNHIFKVHEDQVLAKSILLRDLECHGAKNGVSFVETKVTDPQILS